MRTIEEMLEEFVFEPYRSQCEDFIAINKPLFNTSKGSAIKHQFWGGGYRDHITEVMNIAVVTYMALEAGIRALPFSLSDALVGCFLHDVEKIWKHTIMEEDRKKINKDRLIAAYITMTPDLWNAIHYAHGEGDDYHPTKLVQSPLAAFVHHCDNTSARIWPGEPMWLTDEDRASAEYEFIVKHHLHHLHTQPWVVARMLELEAELDLETKVPEKL